MNKVSQNLISMGAAALGMVAASSLFSVPAYSAVVGAFGWQDSTDDFISDGFNAAGAFPTEFDVIFNPPTGGNGNFESNLAPVTGEFAIDYAGPPADVPVPPNPSFLSPVTLSGPAMFQRTTVITPGSIAQYRLVDDVTFDFTDFDNTNVTIEQGALFLVEYDFDTLGNREGVEGELQIGDFIVTTNGNTYTVAPDPGDLCTTVPDTFCRISGEAFEFEQAFNAPIGQYEGEVSISQVPDGGTVPEPATILGLLTVGGLAFGLRGKKQL